MINRIGKIHWLLVEHQFYPLLLSSALALGLWACRSWVWMPRSFRFLVWNLFLLTNPIHYFDRMIEVIVLLVNAEQRIQHRFPFVGFELHKQFLCALRSQRNHRLQDVLLEPRPRTCVFFCLFLSSCHGGFKQFERLGLVCRLISACQLPEYKRTHGALRRTRLRLRTHRPALPSPTRNMGGWSVKLAL